MAQSIFTKIVKGEIPCSKIYEDEEFLAFLDIAPANKGHTLVIPKQEYETLLDVPDDLLSKLILTVKKVAAAVKEATKAEGYNIFVNNYPAAGQVVPHLHFHIVPRFESDGIKFDWPHKNYSEGEAADFAQKIASHILN